MKIDRFALTILILFWFGNFIVTNYALTHVFPVYVKTVSVLGILIPITWISAFGYNAVDIALMRAARVRSVKVSNLLIFIWILVGFMNTVLVCLAVLEYTSSFFLAVLAVIVYLAAKFLMFNTLPILVRF